MRSYYFGKVFVHVLLESFSRTFQVFRLALEFLFYHLILEIIGNETKFMAEYKYKGMEKTLQKA